MNKKFNLANTVTMNSAVLPHFKKTDSIMYLPMMKNVREKMRRLNLFDSSENLFEAFTLAETLITLTILGVVAAITVPSLINRQMEAANRTKVKKAMAVYEKALNQMIIDNDLKTNEAIIAFGAEKTTDNKPCGSTRPYFKTVEDGTTNCRFKTSDRVWWDITDIEHPIIMLKDDYKTTDLDTASTGLRALAKDTNNKDVYGMVGEINNSIVRINDKGVATGDNATILSKLYGFMNNESSGGGSTANGTPIDANLLELCSSKGTSVAFRNHCNPTESVYLSYYFIDGSNPSLGYTYYIDFYGSSNYNSELAEILQENIDSIRCEYDSENITLKNCESGYGYEYSNVDFSSCSYSVSTGIVNCDVISE